MRWTIVSLLLTVVVSCQAVILSVSPTGIDKDCRTLPCKSLNFTLYLASPGDTIEIAEGIYSGEANRNVLITDISPLSIRGIGQVIIDLQDQGRAFTLVNSQVDFTSITFVNGNSRTPYTSNYKGGAILGINANLQFSNVTFSTCHSFGDDGAGGAIALENVALSMSNVNFVDCSAYEAGGIFANSISGVISNTKFTNCLTTGDGGKGGAVVLEGANNINFAQCEFNGCSSELGGAIYDGTGSDVALTEIVFSSFTNNTAILGGAYVAAGGSQGKLNHCAFTGNVATQNGGAVYTLQNSAPVFRDNYFYNNSAAIGGAIATLSSAIVTLQSNTFRYNYASQGSAIELQGPAQVLSNTIEYNLAALYGALSIQKASDNQSTFVSNHFTGNEAQQGAAIYINQNGLVLNFATQTFMNNTAISSGGAVYVAGASVTFSSANFQVNKADVGGALSVSDGATVTIDLSTFDSNIAQSMGGAIFQNTTGRVVVNQSSMTNNRARSGGALALSDTAVSCPSWSGVTIQLNTAEQCCGSMLLGQQTCPFDSLCVDCTLASNNQACGVNCTCEQGPVFNDCTIAPHVDVLQPPTTTTPTAGPDEVPISTIVPAVVVPVVVVLAVGMFLIVFFVKKRRAGNTVTTAVDMHQMSGDQRLQVPYNELKFNQEIGSGSFGKVFIGEWQKTEVALKLNTSGTSEEFLSEAKLMIALRPHPNIVQFLGLSSDGPYPVMIIEYCDEGSLDTLLFDTNHELTLERQLTMVSAVAKGMYHLHSNNIVHRDLAARNILTSKGTLKISDFGMSRTLQNMDRGTTKTDIGPVRWMAPESLKSRSYSKSSDVWSFGILVFEIVARQEPHTSEDLISIAPRIRDEGLTPEIPSHADPFLAELMQRCWNMNPEARPDFGEICDLLQARLVK